MVARIGGDEFMVLLYDVDVTTAMDTAQRMVGLLSAPYAGIPVGVSVSVGAAMYGGPSDTWQDLAARADQALYMAKEQGKQRAVLAAGPANDPHAP
jgi:diguanylate cyclase (GGDEF)-like protein